jgi:hypothetical protein
MAPHLQELNGCEAELPEGRALLTVGGFEFRRCPALFIEAQDQAAVIAWRTTPEPSFDERMHMPHALAEAFDFLAALEARMKAEHEADG